MSSHKNLDTDGAASSPQLSRRTLLGGLAGAGALMASSSLIGLGGTRIAKAAAEASPGTSKGGYKIDLGGYAGPELTDKPVTLRFMRQDYPPALNELIDTQYKEFQKAYPNISIQEERIPYGDLPKKLQIYVASGKAPDIMMGRNDFTPSYDAGKIALPLQQYFTPEFLADIYDNARDAASAGGNLYCVPWETNTVYMYFNRDLFEKAGVATPPEVTDLSKGWTFEEYVEALKKLKSGFAAKGMTDLFPLSASQHGNGGPGSNYTQLESIYVRGQGDPSAPHDSSAYLTLAGISADGKKASVALDTPEAIKGMTIYQSLFKDGLTPTGAVNRQFESGTAAMLFGGMGNATLFTATPPKFKWGATPAPRGPKIVFNANTSDSPLVWSKAPNPAEAAALLAFLCNDTNRKAFHKVWGSMPARKSLTAQIPQFKESQPFQLAAVVGSEAYSAPKTVGWFDYFNTINPAVKDIALGADPAKTLKTTGARIDQLLKKYR